MNEMKDMNGSAKNRILRLQCVNEVNNTDWQYEWIEEQKIDYVDYCEWMMWLTLTDWLTDWLNEWMNEWMNEWTNERTNERTNEKKKRRLC